MAGFFFNPGDLHLPASPIQAASRIQEWGEMFSNRILIVVSVILCIIMMTDIIGMIPFFLNCFTRARANSDIEHNLTTARPRKIIFSIFIIPFCLILNRFGLYSPEILEKLPPEWQSPAVILAFLVYLLIRFILFRVCKPASGQEDSASIHHAMYSYFIILVLAMMVTCGVLLPTGCPERISSIILYAEIGAVTFTSIIRCGQILSYHHSGFETILYLCVLEIVPAGIFFASGILL